jgi:hypothetical protein
MPAADSDRKHKHLPPGARDRLRQALQREAADAPT